MDAARGSERRVAVLLLDLDGFKLLNDRLGHAVGDDALVRMARQLASIVGPRDTVARLGGDEFLIVCPEVVSVDDTIALAAQAIELEAVCLQGNRAALRFTASVGIAFAVQGEAREELILRADAAMYQAKASRSGYAVAPMAEKSTNSFRRPEYRFATRYPARHVADESTIE